MGLRELQTLQRGWRVWLAWADLAVNVPDYALNTPAVRERLRGTPGGAAFLFYWDRCAFIANGAIMSPFAALFAKELVVASANMGVRGALVLGDKWTESSALIRRIRENYQLAALRGVAFSGVWFEIKKILNSDALQKLDELNFAEAERVALYGEIKQNATLARKFNDTPAELNNWLDAYRKGTRTGGGVIGSINKIGSKIEYTNPAGKLLKWEEQLQSGITTSINSAKNSRDIGKQAEGKVAEFLQTIGVKIEGFGLEVKRTDNSVAAELDVVTSEAIIEVKNSIGAAKEKFILFDNGKPGQAGKLVNESAEDFVNPYSKKTILYIHKPVPRDTQGNLFASDQAYIDDLSQKVITVVNSFDELKKSLN